MPNDSASINLTNHFLIAMPAMSDETFGRSVVYMCEHSERGALGLMINKPSDILVRHEADPKDVRPEMSGHFHPKYRQEIRGRLVSRRCFVSSASKLILPAFGALTGGLDADDSAIGEALGSREAEALVYAAGRAVRFALSANGARAE